jgi:hypothetical protein
VRSRVGNRMIKLFGFVPEDWKTKLVVCSQNVPPHRSRCYVRVKLVADAVGGGRAVKVREGYLQGSRPVQVLDCQIDGCAPQKLNATKNQQFYCRSLNG